MIIFTGGHHNSALLVAKELKKRGNEILWLGHKFSTEDINYISEEYKDVTGAEIEFIDLQSGKIHGGNIKQWWKLFKSILFCLKLFLSRKPQLIVSFGGYLSFPAVVSGWFLGIPSVAHEQTATLGMANSYLLPFLKKLYLAWPIALPGHENTVKVIGLPLPPEEITPLSRQELLDLFSDPNRPLLLISGGKQGSHSINEAVLNNLDSLLKTFNILHQAGNNTQYQDLAKLQEKASTVNSPLKRQYIVFGYRNDFEKLMLSADVILGRSGAHTVYMDLKYGKKMLAVPLTFSYADEQRKNAQRLVEAGVGMILDQERLNSQALVDKLIELKNLVINKDQLVKYQNEYLKDTALQTMADDIETMIKK